MNSEPAVTIIVPMRDVAAFLPYAVASIGPQPDAEILLIDDGSRDDTRAVAAELAEHDPRIRLVEGAGKGPSAARNLGIRLARAPLIAFLDADDGWRPGKLDRQIALHRNQPQIGFSITDYRHVTPAGEDRGSCFAFWQRFAARHAPDRDGPAFDMGADALAQLYAENVVGTSCVVARTDLLREVGGFRCKWGSAEDWDLWLRLAARAPVACIPAVMMDYRMHRDGAISRRAGQRARAVKAIAAEHRAAAAAQNPALARAGDARLLVAAAEAAERRAHALMLRLRALSLAPDRRTLREAARLLFFPGLAMVPR